MRKWLKAGSVITLVVFCGVLWSDLSSRTYIPITKRLKVKHHRESIGIDVLNCMKVELTENEYHNAIKELLLNSVESYPKHDTAPSNCMIAWWDVDFPKEAVAYKLSENGKLRELAAYINGNFYYTFEAR